MMSLPHLIPDTDVLIHAILQRHAYLSCRSWLLGSRNNPGRSAMLPGIESEQPVVMGYTQPICLGPAWPPLGAFSGHSQAIMGPAVHALPPPLAWLKVKDHAAVE
jgi:hypothetical protein